MREAREEKKVPASTHQVFSAAPMNGVHSRKDQKAFSLLDVHGPFSLFLLARKRENGGCKAPAIFMAESSPARKGEHRVKA